MRAILTIFCIFFISSYAIAQIETYNKSDLIGKSMKELYTLGHISKQQLNKPKTTKDNESLRLVESCENPIIPIDSDYIPVPRNDDGSLYLADIGFEFSFCGTSFSDLYINTNGNITFTQPVPQFSPDGFPYVVPMIAPFWADVDTGNDECGQAWYKLFGNYMIVTWENVGWYAQQCSPLNNFQVIISDGTAPIIGAGKNIQFRYGNMEWTTGQASGGGPFGGSPATVGYNSGDNVNFEQIGRFNIDNNEYDGPYGNNDGVHWLDFQCFTFNANVEGNYELKLECFDITLALDDQCSVEIGHEDISTFSINGCIPLDISIDVTSFGCGDVGDHIVTITVGNDGGTETCSSIVSIIEGNCGEIVIEPLDAVCENEEPISLYASPEGGTWGGGATDGFFDPSSVGPGLHYLTYTTTAACPVIDSILVEVFPTPIIDLSPDVIEFCSDEDPLNYLLEPNVSSGDGDYSYIWDTPQGIQQTSSVIPDSSGNYILTVFDGNACATTTSVDVIINPVPDPIIIDPGFICNNLSAVLISASPFGGSFSGDIISSDGYIYPDQLQPGIYDISYTAGNLFNCDASAILSIEIGAVPSVTGSNSGPYCLNDSIFLFGDAENIENISSFFWLGPNGYESNVQNPTDATEAGIYTVMALGFNACISEVIQTEVIVELPPQLEVIGGTLGCALTPIQIHVISNLPNVSYLWEGPNSFTSDISDPFVTSPGFYFITVSTANNCQSIDSVEVIVDGDLPNLEATGDSLTCDGNSVQIFANSSTPGTTFEWSGPNSFVSSDQNPFVDYPGNYVIVATGPNGCKNTVQVEVIIDDIYATLQTNPDTINCIDTSISLNFGIDLSDYTVDWNGPDSYTSEVISPSVSTPGIYFLTVTSVTGCETYDSIEVQLDTSTQVINGTVSTITCAEPIATIDLIGVNGINQYYWSGPSGYSSSDSSIQVSESGDYNLILIAKNGCESLKEFTVLENIDLPDVMGIGDTLSCTSGSGILIETIQDPNTSILWKDSMGFSIGTKDTVIVNAAGIYTLIVVDNLSSCVDSVQVEVFSDENVPDIETQGTSINCLEPNFFIEASSMTDVNYNWSGPNGFISIEAIPEVFEAGSYMITLTASNGCITIETVEVIDDTTVPIFDITADTINCANAEIIIELVPNVSTGAYNWSGPNGFMDTSEDPLINIGGDYSVTVTGMNGCTSVESIQVFENTSIPDLGVSISNNLDCIQTTSILTAFSSYNDLDFSWTGPNGFSSNLESNIITVPGIYSVSVIAHNGCEKDTSIEVFSDASLPTISLDGALLNCYTPDITINTEITNSQNPTIFWNGPNNFTSLEEDPMVISGGTYYVVVTNDNGCSSEDSIAIIENFTTPISNIEVTAFDCTGENAIISSSLNGSQYDYYWESDAGEILMEVSNSISEAGIYFLTITDTSNGCTFTTSEEVFSLNPVIGFDLSTTHPGCLNTSGSITFIDIVGGEENLMYSIDGGENFQESPSFISLDAGVYDAVIVDGNDCEIISQAIITEVEGFDIVAETYYIVYYGEQTQLIANPTLDFDDIESINWSPADYLSCVDCLNPIFSGTDNASYTLTVIDKNGCESEANIEIRIILKELYTPNIFSPNGDGINDVFTIYGDINQVDYVSDLNIYDRWGNMMYTNSGFGINDESAGWDGTFKGVDVQPGVYIYFCNVHMKNGEQIIVKGDITVIR